MEFGLPLQAVSMFLVAYYTGWSTYSKRNVSSIDCSKLTHLIYAFAVIEDGEIALADPWGDIQQPFDAKMRFEEGEVEFRGNFGEFVKLKKQCAHLKTGISVGGQNHSPQFQQVVKDEAAITKFCKSIRKFLESYHFDFVDIDWEFTDPVDANKHSQQLLELFKTLKSAFSDTPYFITFASPACVLKSAELPLAEIQRHISFFNVMTYDYSGSWCSVAEHHAPLEAEGQCIAATVAHYIGTMGVASQKLVLGVSCCGKIFKECNGPGCEYRGCEDIRCVELNGKQSSTPCFLSHETPESIGAKGLYVKKT